MAQNIFENTSFTLPIVEIRGTENNNATAVVAEAGRRGVPGRAPAALTLITRVKTICLSVCPSGCSSGRHYCGCNGYRRKSVANTRDCGEPISIWTFDSVPSVMVKLYKHSKDIYLKFGTFSLLFIQEKRFQFSIWYFCVAISKNNLVERRFCQCSSCGLLFNF